MAVRREESKEDVPGADGWHERCPVCERRNAPGEDDVCEHFVCMLWDSELLAGEEEWKEGMSEAYAAVDALDDRAYEALVAHAASSPAARVLEAVVNHESGWWFDEAEVQVWPVEESMTSGLTRTVYHADPAWYPSVVARLRSITSAARHAGDEAAVRANLEWLEYRRWARKATRARRRQAPLRKTKAGEVLLSHNHVILLHALYDRPRGVATSCGDWERAAVPYASAFGIRASEWAIRRATRTISERLVKRQRRGRCIEAKLTKVGRGIVERSVAAWVIGCGRYEGLRRRGS